MNGPGGDGGWLVDPTSRGNAIAIGEARNVSASNWRERRLDSGAPYLPEG
ncbi:MAG TPA: hypothetical protein P5108_06390 [Marmoricola sp.]|nr:hypothetical protein [Nocardioidaceae bacterium]MCO5323720.1 hypothetical protein [Nocardioidaceae bacterium]HRV69063.1 hypothetical protein [Marmoricola sp.]